MSYIENMKEQIMEYLGECGMNYSYEDDVSGAIIYSTHDQQNRYVSINGVNILCNKAQLLNNMIILQQFNNTVALFTYKSIKWYD